MKLTLLIALALVLALAACAPAATPEPTPTLPPPTETPVPPTSTPEPTPTPDPLLFRDDFDGALSSEWTWLREQPSDHSLTANPGWLEIVAGPGGLGDESIQNVLLHGAPGGKFEIETRVNFRPPGNFQIGGLVIFESPQNFVLFGRAFCGGTGGTCVGDGLYMDLVQDGTWYPDNYATRAPDTDSLFLRLQRDGENLTGLVSEDGENWTTIGRHQSSFNPVFVGLVAGQAMRSVPGKPQFDYFTITALP